MALTAGVIPHLSAAASWLRHLRMVTRLAAVLDLDRAQAALTRLRPRGVGPPRASSTTSGSPAVARYAVAYNIGAIPILAARCARSSVWMPRVFALSDARVSPLGARAQSRRALRVADPGSRRSGDRRSGPTASLGAGELPPGLAHGRPGSRRRQRGHRSPGRYPTPVCCSREGRTGAIAGRSADLRPATFNLVLNIASRPAVRHRGIGAGDAVWATRSLQLTLRGRRAARAAAAADGTPSSAESKCSRRWSWLSLAASVPVDSRHCSALRLAVIGLVCLSPSSRAMIATLSGVSARARTNLLSRWMGSTFFRMSA